jgi:hypothetical protein
LFAVFAQTRKQGENLEKVVSPNSRLEVRNQLCDSSKSFEAPWGMCSYLRVPCHLISYDALSGDHSSMQRNTILLFLFLSFSTSGQLIEGHDLDAFSPFLDESPCTVLSITEAGINCKVGEPFWDTTLFLPFPHLYINGEEINAIRAFPSNSVSETVDFLKTPTGEGASFLEMKRVRLTLSFQPVTPTYLMPYLSDIWLFWGGNRIPYMGKWEVSYLLLVGENWEERQYSGKITPADIPDLQAHLAADVDYNGDPSAFWNYQVELEK